MRWTVDDSIREVVQNWDWTNDDEGLLLEAIENLVVI